MKKLLMSLILVNFMMLACGSVENQPRIAPTLIVKLSTDTLIPALQFHPTDTITPGPSPTETRYLTPTRTLKPTATLTWTQAMISSLEANSYTCIGMVCKNVNTTVTVSGRTVTLNIPNNQSDYDFEPFIFAITALYPGVGDLKMIQTDVQTAYNSLTTTSDASYTDRDWEGCYITVHLHWVAAQGSTNTTVSITFTE